MATAMAVATAAITAAAVAAAVAAETTADADSFPADRFWLPGSFRKIAKSRPERGGS